jgi:asparagine synthase (glutamine-hydrolysing)
VDRPDPGLSDGDAKKQLLDTFDECVRMRMIADVPLGAFLSGGVDSSSVVASMALQSSEPIKTFSVGFEETAYNELPFASLIAKKYRTDHHEIVLTPDSISLCERLVGHFDEPFGDSSAIPTFLVSEFAARHVKVVLTGDGGDELFAGYDSLLGIQRLQYLDHLPQSVRAGLSWVADRLPYSMYGKSYLRMISRRSPMDRYFERNFSTHYLSRRLLKSPWLTPDDSVSWQELYGDYLLPNGADTLSQAWYFEITMKLVGDMLVKVDRMSMANSLEVRSPLLDHELAELAARMRHVWIKNGLGKACLIEAMSDRLPPEIWNRPKQGFSVPIAEWFRGPLREFLWDHLNSPRFLERGFVSPRFMHELLQEHDSGRRNNRAWLWGLLMLELWFRHWQDAPAESPVPALV